MGSDETWLKFQQYSTDAVADTTLHAPSTTSFVNGVWAANAERTFDLTLVFCVFEWCFGEIDFVDIWISLYLCLQKKTGSGMSPFGLSFSVMPSLQLVRHVLYGACEMAGADGVN